MESYHLGAHPTQVAQWREQKYAEREQVLGKAALRQHAPDLIHARTRLDMMWNGECLGLRMRSESGMKFEPLESFDNASLKIIDLTKWFAQTCPARCLISLRFREGFEGLQGIWLDAARVDLEAIKTTQAEWVREATSAGIHIEVGQRGEEWVWDSNDARLKSTKAVLRPWLPSYPPGMAPLPLVATIASFTQPGPLANQTLIGAGHELLDQHAIANLASWGEWGAGNGNLSAAFAPRLGAQNGWISEPDPRSFAALAHNHAAFFAEAEIVRTAAMAAPKPFDLWLLDPPRSGFASLIAKLDEDTRPRAILIYHCALEGLVADQAALQEKGYKLRDWIFCDIFPGSAHAEAVSLWTHSSC